MAFDHSGDLPDYYAFDLVTRLTAEPYQLSYAHELAEKANWLNVVGHKAIVRSTFDTYGKSDAGMAQIGSMMYEALTDTPLVGGDFAGTPTYCDPDSSKIAEEVALALRNYDGFDLETFSYAAVQAMREDAPQLDKFVEKIVTRMLGSDRVFTLRVKTGAALMRTLHITAQQRIDDEAA